MVRRASLAGRAAHTDRVLRARSRRHGHRVGARRCRRRTHCVARRFPGRRRDPTCTALGERPTRRGRGRRGRRPAPLRNSARACSAPGPRRVHRSGRCRLRRGRRRPRRVGPRLGRRPATRRRQRHERVPAARAGPDRVRGRGALGAPARPGTPRTRSSRTPWTDLAAARRGVARAQSRPCSNCGDVPRREPRSRAVRGRVSLDAPARAARRGGLCGPGALRPHRGPVAARAGAARRAGPVAARHADPGAAPVRQHPVGHDLRLSRAARTVAPRRAGVALGLRARVARVIRPQAHAALRRTAVARPPARPAVHAAGGRNEATTSVSGRSSARGSATTSRSRSATRARTIASSCTAASRSGTQRSPRSSSTS